MYMQMPECVALEAWASLRLDAILLPIAGNVRGPRRSDASSFCSSSSAADLATRRNAPKSPSSDTKAESERRPPAAADRGLHPDHRHEDAHADA
ncbi:hypothetical protein PsYK624_061270 [Phanerochaete sordida]|uniref:Uncharacterized protein n=1 Tax=Phanerochaete sordida TaxID=48140 RepID=A0A9P3G813_9APHY|nr:hypothetical protein PsYK624_061270 [Phanerochaete sordida]